MNKLRHTIWLFRKKLQAVSKVTRQTLQRKTRKIWRKLIRPAPGHTYSLAILCIKKREYSRLVIEQANSLHYYNPSHAFNIYTDDICARELEKHHAQFDYPDKIHIHSVYAGSEKAWQNYKIEMIISAAHKGEIVIDADTIWHGDFTIDQSRIYMFAPANVFGENAHESRLISEIFKKPEWLSWTHFVSAFVFIPSSLLCDEFIQKLHTFFEAIKHNSLDFIQDTETRKELHRLAEEIALNLALQSTYPNLVTTFKTSGSKKDRQTLEPMYYGSENRILT